jgi:protein-disulfide isomerase
VFHDLLFGHQPAEGGAGLNDDQLIALAREAGATGESVASGIREGRFVDWSARVTDEASRLGVHGTPTVLVDGRPVTDWTPDGLRAAIRAAAADS